VGSGEQLRQLFYILDSANRFGKMLHSIGDSPMALTLGEARDNFISRQRKSVRSYALKTGRFSVGG